MPGDYDDFTAYLVAVEDWVAETGGGASRKFQAHLIASMAWASHEGWPGILVVAWDWEKIMATDAFRRTV